MQEGLINQRETHGEHVYCVKEKKQELASRDWRGEERGEEKEEA
jgi:hypothetical protein